MNTPLNNLRDRLKEIEDVKSTLDEIDKGVKDYTYRLSLWFFSVTNRWFREETDPKSMESVKALSEKVIKTSYENEGIQYTEFYDSNTGEWLLSGCLWLKLVDNKNYQFCSEFTTCYGDRSRPQNMCRFQIPEEIR